MSNFAALLTDPHYCSLRGHQGAVQTIYFPSLIENSRHQLVVTSDTLGEVMVWALGAQPCSKSRAKGYAQPPLRRMLSQARLSPSPQNPYRSSIGGATLLSMVSTDDRAAFLTHTREPCDMKAANEGALPRWPPPVRSSSKKSKGGLGLVQVVRVHDPERIEGGTQLNSYGESKFWGFDMGMDDDQFGFMNSNSITWTSPILPLDICVGFAGARPCKSIDSQRRGENPYKNLIAVPGSEGLVMIYDTRIPSSPSTMSTNASLVDVIKLRGKDESDNVGMVTSLDFIWDCGPLPTVVCGTESGRIFAKDLLGADRRKEVAVENGDGGNVGGGNVGGSGRSGEEKEDVHTRFPKFDVSAGEGSNYSDEPILCVCTAKHTGGENVKILGGIAGMQIDDECSERNSISFAIAEATLERKKEKTGGAEGAEKKEERKELKITNVTSHKGTKKAMGGKVGISCCAASDICTPLGPTEYTSLYTTGGWDGRIRLFGNPSDGDKDREKCLQPLGIFHPPTRNNNLELVAKDATASKITSSGITSIGFAREKLPEREGGGTIVVSGGGEGVVDVWAVGRQ